MSQILFLFFPFRYGITDNEQKYRCSKSNVDFMTTWENALSVQNGIVKENAHERVDRRYIITLRDGTTYVHLDNTLQLGLYASLVINTIGCLKITGYNKNEPTKEAMFVDLGGANIHALMWSSSCCIVIYMVS